MGRRPCTAVRWRLAWGLLLFVALSFVPQGPGSLDAWVQQVPSALDAATRRAWDRVADLAAYGAGGALCGAAVLQAVRRRDVGRLAAIGLLGCAALAVGAFLKPGFGRLRPPAAWAHDGAYPSGHTATAYLLASALVLAPSDRPRGARLLVVGVAGVAAAARVLSGQHWLSDVLGSVVYGWLVVGALRASGRLEDGGPRSGPDPSA